MPGEEERCPAGSAWPKLQLMHQSPGKPFAQGFLCQTIRRCRKTRSLQGAGTLSKRGSSEVVRTWVKQRQSQGPEIGFIRQWSDGIVWPIAENNVIDSNVAPGTALLIDNLQARRLARPPPHIPGAGLHAIVIATCRRKH